MDSLYMLPETDSGMDTVSALYLEIRMVNGLWIKKRFQLSRQCVEGCSMMPNQDGGDGDNTNTTWALEMMHRCEPRLLVLRELRSMVPALVQCTSNSWFRTINRSANSSSVCLFDGAQLELNFSSMTSTPEFGFCFPRRSFVAERERLDFDATLHQQQQQQQNATTTTGGDDWAGWKRREPSDSDRLRVNKNGWEILYFVQPPKGEVDITLSELRAELCHTLHIDTGRVLFGAGPFQWGPDFEEDGLGLYTTYFDTAIDTGARQMKTVRGAALIDVIEISVQAHST